MRPLQRLLPVGSPKNFAIAFLSLTTLTGATLAWYQYQELSSLRFAALNTDERADWEKRLAATDKRRTELETQLVALQSQEKEDSPAELTAEHAPTEQPRFDRRNGPGNFRAMMDRPDVQRLMAVQQKSALDSRYSALFKNLSLSPAQLDKFKDLLVEKRTAMMDVSAAAREQGINARNNPEAFTKLLSDAKAEIDVGIRSTLGEAAFAQYENYEKTLPQRSVVDKLEQRLSYSTTPLSSQQTDQLVAILTATTPARDNSTAGPTRPNGPAASPIRITDATINQALGVLAAPQMEALRQLQQEQQAREALSATMRNRFQRNAGSASTGAAATAPLSSAPRTSGARSGE